MSTADKPWVCFWHLADIVVVSVGLFSDEQRTSNGRCLRSVVEPEAEVWHCARVAICYEPGRLS